MSFQSPVTDEGSTRGLIELRDHAPVRLAPRVAIVAVAVVALATHSYTPRHTVGRRRGPRHRNCVPSSVLILFETFPPFVLHGLKFPFRISIPMVGDLIPLG